MKRALLAFVCAFALSAPAFAGTGLTFSPPHIIEGEAPPLSFGNATEAWIAKVTTSISGPSGKVCAATRLSTWRSHCARGLILRSVAAPLTSGVMLSILTAHCASVALCQLLGRLP